MKQKKVIVHLIQSLNIGGTEQVLLKTLPRLSKEFKHIIITLKEPGELAKKFSEKNIKVLNLAAKGLFDLAYKKKLARFVNKLKPTLIITHMFHADLAGRLLLTKKTHAPVIASLVSTYNSRRYLPARVFEKFTKGMAEHYFANSEAVKNYYVANLGVKADKITVIHNGIDVSIYEKSDDKDIVRELKLSEKRIVISCVANLAINKGHSYLIKAFEEIFPKYPQSYLIIVGEGPERENIERQVANYRSKIHIKFLGRRNDVPKILAVTDIFVLPTFFEGLSNAILEAMASGCAVITTDIPENRVMIKNNKTGLLVPLKNYSPIKSALEILIENNKKRQKLGRAAKQFVKTNFDLANIVRKLDKEIKFYSYE